MPTVNITKSKVRRGTDTQRVSIILDEGELAYTTDKKRLYVGDGISFGGNIVGAKVFTSTNKLTETVVEKGDVVYESNKQYLLTDNDATNADNWEYIGTVPDNSTIVFTSTNTLSVNPTPLQDQIAQLVTDESTIVVTANDTLSVNPAPLQDQIALLMTDNDTVVVTANNTLSVDNVHLNTANTATYNNTLGVDNDLLGVSCVVPLSASTTGVALNIDTDYFDISGSKLTLNIDTTGESTLIGGLSSNFKLVPGLFISDPELVNESDNYNAFSENLSSGKDTFSGSIDGPGNPFTVFGKDDEGDYNAPQELKSAGFVKLARPIRIDGVNKNVAIPIFLVEEPD